MRGFIQFIYLVSTLNFWIVNIRMSFLIRINFKYTTYVYWGASISWDIAHSMGVTAASIDLIEQKKNVFSPFGRTHSWSHAWFWFFKKYIGEINFLCEIDLWYVHIKQSCGQFEIKQLCTNRHTVNSTLRVPKMYKKV